MIVRSLRLRHGRTALPRSSTLTPRSLRRHYAAEPERNPKRNPNTIHPLRYSDGPPATPAPAASRTVAINDPTDPVAQDYAFFQHQKERTQHLGADIAPHYKPHELLAYPPSPQDITLELLIASQSHLGHATSLWHPANAQYIFGVRGERDPIHIISPDVTAAHLRRACKVVSGVTERGGLVLFVGTRDGHDRAVVKAAQMAKGCHLFTKWIPGSITNGQQILGRCGKKVVNEHDEEVTGFEDQLDAKAVVKPDLVVCLNPLENYVLLHECGLNNIPTIGIIDTDANPTWVTYPIAANDDSLRCIQVVAGVLGRAGQQGQAKRLQKAKRGIVDYQVSHGLTAPTGEAKPARKRMPRRQPTPPIIAVPEPANDKLNFPADVEGVPVTQHEDDQALLSAASEAIRDESEAAGEALSKGEQEETLSEGHTELQAEQLDPEIYNPAEDVSEADRLEFGGNRIPTPSSPVLANAEQELSEDEPELNPNYTSVPSQTFTAPARPTPTSSAAPEVTDSERALSEEDAEPMEYGTSASEASAPKSYPPTSAAAAAEEEVSRDMTDQERLLSEEDPEMDPIWKLSSISEPSLAASSRGHLRRRVRKAEEEVEEEEKNLQQALGEPEPDFEPEYVPTSSRERVEAAGRKGESTLEQVGEVQGELGEQDGQAVPEATGELGVRAEEPVVEAAEAGEATKEPTEDADSKQDVLQVSDATTETEEDADANAASKDVAEQGEAKISEATTETEEDADVDVKKEDAEKK